MPRAALSLGRSGHSLAHPRLLTEAGLESLYILNVSPEERVKRIEDKSLQFIWRPLFDQLGRRTEMFTHIIYDNDVSALDLHVSDSATPQLRKGHRDDDDFEDMWGYGSG